MKKLRALLIFMSLVTLLIFCLSSCGSPAIEKPSGFRLDPDTLMLNWDKVPGASAYSVKVGEKVKTTKANSYSLESLAPGEYSIEITALGDGVYTGDSKPAIYEFKREKESGLLYKLINNNMEYELVGVGSASGDVVMDDEFRGKPVTSMAPSAVAYNSAITSFTVGKYVTEIPKKAFYNCSAMVSVTIPYTVTSVGPSAFQSCKNLVSVELPDSITEIGENCFAYCRALTNVKMGRNVTKIGAYAFQECSALESINIPSTVIRIENDAFFGCESATSITMGDLVKYIGDNAFHGCSLASSLKLSNAIEYIGVGAFEYCSKIPSIVLPDSLKDLDERAFAFCENLAEVNIGDNVEHIGSNAFMGTMFLDDSTEDIVYLGNWILICKNPGAVTDKGGDLIISDGIIGVADLAFYGCNTFTGVNLPDVKYVGSYAFYRCGNLMNVDLGPEALTIGDFAFAECPILSTVKIEDTSLTHIGDFAFNGCKISSIKLPDTLVSIGTYAFTNNRLKTEEGVIYADNWVVGHEGFISNVEIKGGTVGIADYSFLDCQMISDVEFPDSLRYIGKGAFLLCTMIYIDEFPAELERIGDYAFYGCAGARFGVNYDAVLPEGLEYIGRSAFYQSNVAGMNIPGSCKYIGDYAFFECPNLGVYLKDEDIQFELTLNEGIEYIGTRAFYGCNGLVDVDIPNSVNEMGIRAFYNCTSLESVTVGYGLKEIPDYTFFGCEKLESVKLSNKTEKIGFKAFMNCKSLENIDFGTGLLEIGDYAFRGCESLEQPTLPDSLFYIGEFAFRGNIGATSTVIPKEVSVIGQHAVYGNSRATIYCEADSVPEGWHERWNSSFRPVFFGCTLSDDNSYVVSFEKTEKSIINGNAVNGIAGPTREGYDFAGWSTVPDGEVEYTAEDVVNAPNGTLLYAIWTEELPEEDGTVDEGRTNGTEETTGEEDN